VSIRKWWMTNLNINGYVCGSKGKHHTLALSSSSGVKDVHVCEIYESLLDLDHESRCKIVGSPIDRPTQNTSIWPRVLYLLAIVPSPYILHSERLVSTKNTIRARICLFLLLCWHHRLLHPECRRVSVFNSANLPRGTLVACAVGGRQTCNPKVKARTRDIDCIGSSRRDSVIPYILFGSVCIWRPALGCWLLLVVL
jgi:hypothetical protein